MVKAWEARGTTREKLLKQWMSSGQDIATCTVELITSEETAEKSSVVQDFLTPEQVLQYYCGNEDSWERKELTRQGFAPSQRAILDGSPSTPAPGGPGNASAGVAETKAAKSKARPGNPVAVFDVRKAKLSQIETTAFPVVDRVETRKMLESAVLAKAGQYAKILVQLKGHEASGKALEDLARAKDALETAWEDVKNVPADADETTWANAMKAATRMYIYYGSKEDFARGDPPEPDNPQPASAASSSAASSQGLQPRGLKRAAEKLYKRLAKKPRATSDLSNVPEHLKDDWHGYSRLEHMARTPMASTVLKGLNKKGADINWLCRDVCGAAVKEGSEFFHTRVLSTVSSERSFHSKLAKELPRVDLVSLPVQVRKKLGQQTFSMVKPSRWFEWMEKDQLLDVINEDHSLRDVVRTEGPLDIFVRIHGDEGAIPGHLLVSRAKFPKAVTTVDAIMEILATDLQGLCRSRHF
ncbi:hypothetical protein AK812_SmicGene4845 [Symbiodinium microadriaticum]|uniref:Uncharacterized protein n=1 Tax=Symbiodinium microadriaticum TaxID=2951 RepID=A0A1Q9EV91_SYMMI|nr:hypothetical protein AK812_SmicGene4845 [Symbiodinium microadriaticum]